MREPARGRSAQRATEWSGNDDEDMAQQAACIMPLRGGGRVRMAGGAFMPALLPGRAPVFGAMGV